MAEAEFTEFIGVRLTPEQKEYYDKQLPNPAKWIRALIQKQMEDNKNG